jgi:predicted porin
MITMTARLTVRRLGLTASTAIMISSAFAAAPLRAADLAGDCCADLEERVAELEATTVRKGNKKVSVTLYGQVNRAVLFWDDGAEQNTYVVDNNYESSRFGVKGSAKTGLGDWIAGYRLEAETTGANSARLDQFDDDNADDANGSLFVRQSYMYLANKKWGEMRLGLTGTPVYNITKDTNVTELEDTMHGDNRMMMNFFLRPSGYDNAEGLSKLRWQSISRCYSSSNAFVCSTRRNGAAYWSPSLAGFSFSAGWFEDDDWGAAVRYKNEWGENWEVGAGFGYEDVRDERLQNGGGGVASGANPPPSGNINYFQRDIQEWGGSGSIKHKPTGLFAYTAFMFSDQGDTNTINAGYYTGTSAPLMNSWEMNLGIQRKIALLGLDKLGDTSLWGGYSNIHNGLGAGSNGNGGNLGQIPADRYLAAGTFANVQVPTEITGADVDRWSLAFDQAIDAANMHLYAVYQHLTPEVDLVTRDPSVLPNGKLKSIGAPLDDFDLFYTGGRIYF